MLALLAAIVGYGGLGLNQRVALFAHAITRNFSLQVAVGWLPLWAVCTASAFPVAWYTFCLQRKFGLIAVGPLVWLRDYLKKTNALALLFGAALVEIAFLSNMVFPSYGWIPRRTALRASDSVDQQEVSMDTVAFLPGSSSV